MVSVPIAMCLEGDLPFPDIVSVWEHACDRESDMMFTAIATEAGCPQFKLDAPLSSDYETVHYMAEQLSELIEFTKAKIPGAKMNWENLEARVNAEAEATRLLRRQLELRRKVPCPISGQDVFRGFAGRDDRVKGLEYIRVQTEEVEEESGKRHRVSARRRRENAGAVAVHRALRQWRVRYAAPERGLSPVVAAWIHLQHLRFP